MKFLTMNRGKKNIAVNENDNGENNTDFDSIVGESNVEMFRPSVSTETSEQNRVLNHLQKYYYTEEEKTESCIFDDNNSDVMLPVQLKPKKLHEDFALNCGVCKIQKQGKNDNFIVLSCNHIFHVCCLTENHFTDIMEWSIIDQEYFRTRKCTTCFKQLETEELMFLHSKFLAGTKDRLSSHDISIENLENRLKVLKEELRTCYEYKHKLEREREKSKQIVATLMTMM
jgi:hypothetical protein